MGCTRLQGFTIVELVTVIMVLAILSLGTIRFLNDAGNGYAATVNRVELAADVRAGMDRMSREIREALPNSARVDAAGACLELIPVSGGSIYLTAPIGYAAPSMQAVPFDSATLDANTRVAIPMGTNPYQLGTLSEISPTVTVSGPDANNEIAIQFASSHAFPSASARRRLFLVSAPISYCVDTGALWRYTNYGFSDVQPGTSSLPSALPNRTLVARHVQGAAPFFDLSDATLTRNAIVYLNFQFSSDGDGLGIESMVHMKNVP